METLGDFLKHRREEAGLSLEDLAGRTRIRVENLRSLEREDLEALPTDPYVRGFVKLVCRELGLEPSDGIVRYETLRERSGPPDEMTWDEETTETAPGLLERALGDPEQVVRKAAVVGRWGGLAALTGVVAILGILLVRWIDPFAPRTTRPVAYLAEEPPGVPAPELVRIPDRPQPEPTPAAVDPPAEAPARKADPAPKPAAVEVAQVQASPPPARQEAEPAVRQAPRQEAPAAPAPVASTPAPQRSTAAEAVAAEGDRVVLRVEAVRPVRVSVLLDGVGFPRTRSLAAGETATWKASESFVVNASDGGAVRIFLGERSLGPAGADGAEVEGLTVRPW